LNACATHVPEVNLCPCAWVTARAPTCTRYSPAALRNGVSDAFGEAGERCVTTEQMKCQPYLASRCWLGREGTAATTFFGSGWRSRRASPDSYDGAGATRRHHPPQGGMREISCCGYRRAREGKHKGSGERTGCAIRTDGICLLGVMWIGVSRSEVHSVEGLTRTTIERLWTDEDLIAGSDTYESVACEKEPIPCPQLSCRSRKPTSGHFNPSSR